MSEHAIEADVDGQLYKAHIEVEGIGGTSSQVDDDPDLGTPQDAITPPESLERLAELSTFNSTRKAIIDAVALNVVGLGYRLEVGEGHERDQGDARDEIARATERLEAAARRDTRLAEPSLTELLRAVKTDEEEVGWGFAEVSRSRDSGLIDGLFHVPGKRMRRLRDRSGYALVPPSGDLDNATRFANFGEKVAYRNAQPTASLADGHAGGWQRNEVIAFKLYTSESRDYGLPRDAAMVTDYLGDKLAGEANVGFFANGGALPTVLFVQGEERKDGATINVTVPAEVTQRIYATLRSKGEGAGNTGRVAIVPLPAGVKAQKEILGQASERDIGNVAVRDDWRQRTLSAFRLSGIFIGLEGDGRYSAEVERAMGKEQVFDPEQDRYQRRLRPVLRDLGFPQLSIIFNDLAVEDAAARRSSAEKGAEVGGITWREWRTAHGWAPLPEATKAGDPLKWHDGQIYMSVPPEPGQVPFGWNDSLIPAVGRPPGSPQPVAGDGQQGLRPGLGGRDSRDRGQGASAGRVGAQADRLTGVAAGALGAGARRALERARALPVEG